MHKLTALGVVLAAAISAPVSSFEMNASMAKILSDRDTLSVRDLAVGEVGNVTYADFCTSDGRVYGQGIMALQEASGLSSVIQRMKRMPGGAFELTIDLVPNADKPLSYWVANFAAAASRPCDYVSDNLFEITTINGAHDLESLLEASKKAAP